jgi:CheY-like chemotaxis protein
MSKNKIDIIISDLNTGGLEGYEFVDKVHESPIFSKKKLLIFSSDANNPIFKKYPDIIYVDKSSGMTKLMDKIAEIVEEMN